MKSKFVQNAENAGVKLQEMTDKEYLRSADVVNLFSISNSTLRNLRNSKELPYYKLGGTFLYKKTEIEACIKKITSEED